MCLIKDGGSETGNHVADGLSWLQLVSCDSSPGEVVRHIALQRKGRRVICNHVSVLRPCIEQRLDHQALLFTQFLGLELSYGIVSESPACVMCEVHVYVKQMLLSQKAWEMQLETHRTTSCIYTPLPSAVLPWSSPKSDPKGAAGSGMVRS